MRTHPLFAVCVAFAIWCTLAACDKMTLQEEPAATAGPTADGYPLVQAAINASLDDALAAVSRAAARRAAPASGYSTLSRVLTQARDGNWATARALQVDNIMGLTEKELREIQAVIADDPALQAEIAAVVEKLKAKYAAIPPVEVTVQPLDDERRPTGKPYEIRSEDGVLNLGSSTLTVQEFLLVAQAQYRPERGFTIDYRWEHHRWGKGRKWPSGNVYYFFSSSLSGETQDWMKRAMARMTAGTGIRFYESRQARWWLELEYWLGLSNKVKIDRDQLGDYTMGWATVGKRPWAKVVMDTENVRNESAFNHELGHVVGLLHEHQRYDRDRHVTVPSSKSSDDNYRIIPRIKSHWTIWGTWYFDHSTTRSTPYDFQSVMHYERSTGITLRSGDTDDWDAYRRNKSRWRNQNGDTYFTPWDIYTIRSLYGMTPNSRPNYTPVAP